MACHPEQPFTAAQEDRIREMIREDRAGHGQSDGLGGEVQGVAVHDDAYASGSDARS
ncbi:hypothetical protein [Sphingomonas sp. DC2300-3]|uniref:hypothetical protein n=1 Tax=unclassified Sphingomonas TaxID=196159 RepID=UPI003CF7EDDF